VSTPQPPPIDWQAAWASADHNAQPGPADGYLAVVTYDGQPPARLIEPEREELVRLRGEVVSLRSRMFAQKAWLPGMPVPEGADPSDVRTDFQIGALWKAREYAQSAEGRRLAQAEGWQPGGDAEYPGTLADSLARERPPQRYLIEGLWGVAHNLSIEAMFKTGKTTLAGSVAGSLADGTPFLGFRAVHKPDRAAGLWNCEMDPDDFDDYLTPHVTDRTRIAVAHLRGHPMPLMSSAPARAEAVGWLREHEVAVWIIDSWTRLCAWCGIDPIDNFAVSKLTAVLDEIKAEAGVTALAVTAHMPHAAKTDRESERALGAQAFSGWVDAMWRYTSRAGGRYLSAEGRKVALAECQVFLDGAGKLVAQAGDRDSAEAGGTEFVLLMTIQNQPGLSTEQLRRSVSKRKGDVTTILRILAEHGRIFFKEGPRKAVLWYPAGWIEGAPG
jgi:hypothetical protein